MKHILLTGTLPDKWAVNQWITIGLMVKVSILIGPILQLLIESFLKGHLKFIFGSNFKKIVWSIYGEIRHIF